MVLITFFVYMLVNLQGWENCRDKRNIVLPFLTRTLIRKVRGQRVVCPEFVLSRQLLDFGLLDCGGHIYFASFCKKNIKRSKN